MTALPNPFCSSAEVVMPSAETAVVSPVNIPGTVDAAATPFDPFDFNAITHVELIDRGFDIEAFMDAIEPPPLFLQAPVDVLNVLAGY